MLGIEPTDDKKAIRRAFAAQSRFHHPEEEPEYFAALNQAYKEALDYGAGGEKKWETPASFLPERKSKKETEYRESPRESGQEESRGEESVHKKTNEKVRNLKLPRENERPENENTLDEKAQKRPQEKAQKRPQEKAQEETEDSGESSLLKRLDQAAQQAIKKISEQTVCPSDNLPMGLLQELAIAYAFIPHFEGEEYFEGLWRPGILS